MADPSSEEYYIEVFELLLAPRALVARLFAYRDEYPLSTAKHFQYHEERFVPPMVLTVNEVAGEPDEGMSDREWLTHRVSIAQELLIYEFKFCTCAACRMGRRKKEAPE